MLSPFDDYPIHPGADPVALDDFDPTDFHSLHLQNIVVSQMGDRTGIGVLEQAYFGSHAPSGLTGLNNGFSA